ncbi:MAG: hypothetical protein CSYNP_01617 [Syntrophus sp. SKADARSKE-3]|nr:hypothetical protein [Syntrophus sp. SKADARSKE-3]
MTLATSLDTYRIEVALYNGFISRAFTQDSSRNYILTEQERSFVVDSAFLRIFISWETFLESAFISYLIGESSTSGRVAIKYASPQDAQHACEMLIGTQKYVDWANPEIVRRLSRLYFDNGDPIYQVLSSIQSDLFDIRTIRNAAAHLSFTTGHQLDALASRKLRRPHTSITVGDLILSLDPNRTDGTTILANYLSLLDAAAFEIATWP